MPKAHTFVLVLMVLMVLSGCAQPRLSIDLPDAEIGAPLYTSHALSVAEAQFLDIGFAALVLVRTRAADVRSTFDDATSVRTTQEDAAPRLHVRAEWQRPLSGGLQLVTRLDWRLARTVVRFPDGIDVFTDPTTAQLTGHEVSGEAGLALPIGAGVQAFVGAGLATSSVKTHVTSALLDVRSETSTLQPYLALGLSRRVGRDFSMQSELRAAPGMYPDLSISLAKRF